MEETSSRMYDTGTLCKVATEKLFKYLSKHKNVSFNACNVEYNSGYFIWYYGQNRIVEFSIKELPDWSFGLWWLSEVEDRDEIKGILFAQFTEEIDKFKPTASRIQCDVKFVNNKIVNAKDAYETISFIYNEPYKAFAIDVCCEHSDITEEDAHNVYNSYVELKQKEAVITSQNNSRMIDEILEIWHDEIERGAAFLSDYGKCISPRHEIVVNGNDERWSNFRTGTYGLEDIDEECYNEFIEIRQECDYKADLEDIYWYCEVTPNFSVVTEKRFNELKEKIQFKKESEDNE